MTTPTTRVRMVTVPGLDAAMTELAQQPDSTFAVQQKAASDALAKAVRQAAEMTAVNGPAVFAQSREAQIVNADTFTRADSATLLGGSWEVLAGTWGIASNRAYAAVPASSTLAVLPSGSRDHEIEVTVNPSATGVPGAAVRVVDKDNLVYVMVRPADGLLRLSARVAGAASTLVSVAKVFAGGVDVVLRVRCVRNMVRIWVDGQLVLRHRLSTTVDAATASGVKAGLFASTSDTVTRFDDVKIRNLGAGLLPDGPDAWGAVNAAAALVTPTHDGSGQAVHPDVYDFGAGNAWNGYRYWMAHTPYPFGDDTLEKPNILASNDGDTWVVPPGMINPISTGFDPEIAVDGDRMYVISQGMKVTWCDDGSSAWSAQQILFPQLTGEVSPTVIQEDDGTWRMWTIQKRTLARYRLLHRTATSVMGPWSAPEEIVMPNDLVAGRDLWHIDVQKHEGAYWAVVAEATKGTSGSGTQLYMATSRDGYAFAVSGEPVLPTGESTFWDDGQIYRACIIPRGSGDSLTFDLWYSARKTSGAWNIGRTTIERLRGA